jgi:hypothetical protein
MSSELAKEVERELAATTRAVGDRVKSREFDETVMVKLLDQYSERLVNMLDEKIAASVAQKVRESSITNFSDGADSPLLARAPSSRADSESVKSSLADDTNADALVIDTTEKSTME